MDIQRYIEYRVSDVREITGSLLVTTVILTLSTLLQVNELVTEASGECTWSVAGYTLLAALIFLAATITQVRRGGLA